MYAGKCFVMCARASFVSKPISVTGISYQPLNSLLISSSHHYRLLYTRQLQQYSFYLLRFCTESRILS